MNTQTNSIEFTRKEYLNQECTYEQYYNQFLTPAIIAIVANRFSIDELKEAYQKNESFNSIPLAAWDSLAYALKNTPTGLGKKLRDAGDFLTLSGQVCVLKAAARKLAIE